MARSSLPVRVVLLIFLISSPAYSFIAPKFYHVRSAMNLRASVDASLYRDLHVMVNGMPGPMATAAAQACLRKGLSLAPVGLTGPDVEACTIEVKDEDTGRSASVRLISSVDMDEAGASLLGLRAGAGEENVVAIDYTHPSAVNGNARWYVEQRLPFVTGRNFAVIAPNMGKQIVAMQAALEDLANKFPAAFDGYKLDVTESHQKTKADTSGTARAVIGSLSALSAVPFDVDSETKMLRDDASSLDFGVSKDALNGHAFHTYQLTSPDGSVRFELQHNVEGRRVYAEGTADAVKFLYKKIKEGKGGKVYSMINVLEEGALG